MSPATILGLILVAVLAIGGAFAGGYKKGTGDEAIAAKGRMDKHLLDDEKASSAARDALQKKVDDLAKAQNAVSAAYEKGKQDAEKTAQRTVADLRTGNLVLRERWTACKAAGDVPSTPPSPSEPDAGAADREESAGRIIQAAAQCDAQVKGLQELLRLERTKDVQKSQPQVDAHVGTLPD